MTGRQKTSIAWLVIGLLWIAAFIPLEWYGLSHDDAVTLSRWMYTISAAWPPIIFMFGLTVGILTEHFWRHVNSGLAYIALPPWLRYALLFGCWALSIFLIGGGPSIFIAGFGIGMAVTYLWWPWNPADAQDHRG